MEESPARKKLRDIFQKKKAESHNVEISGGMSWGKKDTDIVWVDELAKLNNTFYLKFLDPNVKEFFDKLKEKYPSDPLVIEFCNKYRSIAKFLKEISEEKITDPHAKADYIYSRLIKDDAKMLKEFGVFYALQKDLTKKLSLFSSIQKFENKTFTLKELSVLESNIASLFQWVPKYDAHLNKVPEEEYTRQEVSQRPTRPPQEIAKLFENFKKALNIYNKNVKNHELEILLSRIKNPFHSVFRRKNIATLESIASYKASDIADFLVNYPHRADVFLAKPRREGRNFLDEFYKDPVSLEKMLDGPAELRDKVNKAFNYWPSEKPLPASLDTCIAPLQKVVMPNVLRDVLIQKIQDTHKKGFPLPDVATMNNFAKNLDNALKSGDGLSFKKFVDLLNTNQMNAVFNLGHAFFEQNKNAEKAFKAPVTPVPPPRSLRDRPLPAPRTNTNSRPSTH